MHLQVTRVSTDLAMAAMQQCATTCHSCATLHATAALLQCHEPLACCCLLLCLPPLLLLSLLPPLSGLDPDLRATLSAAVCMDNTNSDALQNRPKAVIDLAGQVANSDAVKKLRSQQQQLRAFLWAVDKVLQDAYGGEDDNTHRDMAAAGSAALRQVWRVERLLCVSLCVLC